MTFRPEPRDAKGLSKRKKFPGSAGSDLCLGRIYRNALRFDSFRASNQQAAAYARTAQGKHGGLAAPGRGDSAAASNRGAKATRSPARTTACREPATDPH